MRSQFIRLDLFQYINTGSFFLGLWCCLGLVIVEKMTGEKPESKVVQVTNICPNINADQMKTFLSFIGRLDQFKLYPERINLLMAGNLQTKVAYAKFSRAEDAAVALHLTNTV